MYIDTWFECVCSFMYGQVTEYTHYIYWGFNSIGDLFEYVLLLISLLIMSKYDVLTPNGY